MRSEFPDALEMRELKYVGETPPEEKERWAQALRAVGRRAEAILLFEGRADSPKLREDLAWAVTEGASYYPFTLRRMGLAVSDDEIRACAAAAERKERWFDAHRCYEALHDEAALERVRQRLPGYKPAIPANKA